MSSCNSLRGSSPLPPMRDAGSKALKLETFGFAILVIFGIGGLIVSGVGTGGLLHIGALTNLGQANSIIMVVIGGVGGIGSIALSVSGIIWRVNTHFGPTERSLKKATSQDTAHSNSIFEESEDTNSILEESEDTKQKQERFKKSDEDKRALEEDKIRVREELETKKVEQQKRAEELEATRQREEQQRKDRAEVEKEAREAEAALKQKKELEAKKIEEEKKTREIEADRLKEVQEEKLKKTEQEKIAQKRELIRREEDRLEAEIKQEPQEKNLSQIFTEKVKFFKTCNLDSSTLVHNLSKIIPNELSLHDAVNIIFENCSRTSILPLLDALLCIDTSFTLPPYDKIRRNIVEDKQHLLTNSTLIAMLKECELDTQKDKLAACYDLAYRMNHPYIYCLSSTTILADVYTLNFLWVNLNPQDRIHDISQNIFKDGMDMCENAECILDPEKLRTLETSEKFLEKEDLKHWKGIKKSFTYKISKWADIHPKAQINIWYDSALVTQKAQQKTFEMMREISKSRGVNLRLRDIRQLPSVTGEIEHSLHPGTQVYYRVDLLKALIGDHMLSSSEENAQYCVVSDIDVEPMTSEQIFDKRTLGYLDSAGYVFNRVGLSDFENSFFIFNKANKDIYATHNETVIQQAAADIAELRTYPINTSFRNGYILGAQSIYNLYGSFRDEMEDKQNKIPRKIVQCPQSQFNFGGNFSKSDYQSETFRFIGDSNIPYTRNGRNYLKYDEAPIDSLKDWRVEPL